MIRLSSGFMCGIVGFVTQPSSDEVLSRQINVMAETMVLRGPDSRGAWMDGKYGIALGHRRLSILDLSPLGHQPMVSRSGRFVMVLNGEIYNFQDLRERLRARGASFKGGSDTEVLLEAIEHWGLRRTLEESVGMFALALWDRQDSKLFLARDRFGEKPLYYGFQNKCFLFGSELKALQASAFWVGDINRQAVECFFRHGYIPGPLSIFEGIFKLEPGSFLEIDSSGFDSQRFSRTVYWSPLEVVNRCLSQPFGGSEQEAQDQLEFLLKRSVKGQMISDVPLGAFLSGGIDSSLIVALMQAQTTKRVKTFTIGFREEDFNEAVYAKRVAQHLGTDHTELYLTAKDSLDVVRELPRIYDEPFADSSQIPTLLVSRLAKSAVTVALSGDAGDELFAGYTRYAYTQQVWTYLQHLPVALRRVIGSGLGKVPYSTWNSLSRFLGPLLPRMIRQNRLGEKMKKAAFALPSVGAMRMYQNLISDWPNADKLVLGLSKSSTLICDRDVPGRLESHVESMMYLDMTSYLPDDILVKVDRAAMSVSLETRVPFLDHRVAEFAWTLPLSMKLDKKGGKKITRALLHKHVPPDLVDRPKMGFGIPISDWLRSELKDWAGDLLSHDRLSSQGILNADMVSAAWNQHLKGERECGSLLWDVVMFQAWVLESNSFVQERPIRKAALL